MGMREGLGSAQALVQLAPISGFGFHGAYHKILLFNSGGSSNKIGLGGDGAGTAR